LEELQPGDPVQVGPYRLTGVLGAGGMGQVFLGWSSGGRPVAVKVIKRELAADPEFRARFCREVAAARTISGLYTALLIDADVDGPVPWLATAYVDGPSLNEAVSIFGPLPAGSVLALAAGLAEALAAVHAIGLVHRDLKPSNVLLASDGPRVIDFGISRAADTTTLTKTGQSIGSPGYLSPEQAAGGEVGPPGDIFSLGAVLAFAASGTGPFGTGSPPVLVYRVVYEPPSLEGVPEKLRPLIGRCLAKEPADRPTANDLLADLAGIQPGAQWLPERITAALAEFAVTAPTGAAAPDDAAYGRTATFAAPPDGAPASAAPADAAPQPGSAAVAASPARGTSRPRRFPWLRRSLLVPVASAVAVLAAVTAVLAATLGGPGRSYPITGGPTVSAGAHSAAAHPAAPTADTPSPLPSKSATPTPSPSREATARPAGPKSIAGTYTFSRQVLTCTYINGCGGGTPLVIQFNCPADAPCVASGRHWGSSHAVTFNGTTIYFSALDPGFARCKGTPVPTTITLDLNVLSWSAGQGGAVRTPTQIQGSYSFASPASEGCTASQTQQVLTYG
jgi:eukaryotic-like serine/threonine-protein kinase